MTPLCSVGGCWDAREAGSEFCKWGPSHQLKPFPGSVWRDKRTKREAVVLHVREDGPFRGLDYRYRTPNPESRAKYMTRSRRMTVPISMSSFLRRFERVAGKVVELKFKK